MSMCGGSGGAMPSSLLVTTCTSMISYMYDVQYVMCHLEQFLTFRTLFPFEF